MLKKAFSRDILCNFQLAFQLSFFSFFAFNLGLLIYTLHLTILRILEYWPLYWSFLAQRKHILSINLRWLKLKIRSVWNYSFYFGLKFFKHYQTITHAFRGVQKKKQWSLRQYPHFAFFIPKNYRQAAKISFLKTQFLPQQSAKYVNQYNLTPINHFFLVSKSFVRKFLIQFYLKNDANYRAFLQRQEVKHLQYPPKQHSSPLSLFFLQKLERKPYHSTQTINVKANCLKLSQEARKIHWEYSDHTVLREHTYKRFLKKDVHYYQRQFLQQPSLYALCFYNLWVNSTQDYEFLLTNQLLLVNGLSPKANTLLKVGDIVQFASGLFLNLYYNFILRSTAKRRAKARRWQKLQKIYRHKPWVKQRFKLPKKVKEFPALQQWESLRIQVDWVSASCCLINLPRFFPTHPDWIFRYTRLLRLYGWRYRAE